VSSLDKSTEQDDQPDEQREQRHDCGVGNGSGQHEDVVFEETTVDLPDRTEEVLHCDV